MDATHDMDAAFDEAQSGRAMQREAEMTEAKHYTYGGNGSHWDGCHETHWDCRIAWLEKQHLALAAENARLRELLAVSYSGAKLYCDDGCLNDSSERPFIDFRNDSVADLSAKMTERGMKALATPPPAEPAQRWRSCADWPESLNLPGNATEDTHDTREAAEAVCRGLERRGFGGDGKVFPLRTRVEPVPPPAEPAQTRAGEWPTCPDCGSGLFKVYKSPASPLNDDQFDAVKAGDYYCDKCPSNDRGNLPYRYFWKRELVPASDAGGERCVSCNGTGEIFIDNVHGYEPCGRCAEGKSDGRLRCWICGKRTGICTEDRDTFKASLQPCRACKRRLEDKVDQAKRPAGGETCPKCGGSGFSGPGTGYGDVCDECGGQSAGGETRR